ncbi:MAG: ROK family protein [Candidatus Diapherotrites archaeon]
MKTDTYKRVVGILILPIRIKNNDRKDKPFYNCLLWKYIMPLIEGFDIGGTSIRAALIRNEKMIAKKTIPSTKEGHEKLFSTIQILSKEIRSSLVDEKVDYTVIGLPGPTQDRVLLNSATLGIASPVSLEPLFHFFPNPLRFENDMKLAVKAEYFHEQGKKQDSFYVLTFSTGIGAGLVWNKKVLEGTMGEFGHIILNTHTKSPACSLGHTGCWFAYSSGFGIQKRAEKEMNQSLSTIDVFSLAKEGNAIASSIISDARRANAQGIGTMLNVFAVERIVVMGSIGLSQFTEIIPTVKEIQPYTIHPIPSIIPTSLGDDIGLWGAYYSGVSSLLKKS